MQTVRVAVKFSLFLVIIIVFGIVSSLNFFLISDYSSKLKNANHISSFFCKLLLKAICVRFTVNNSHKYSKDQNYLIVSNHLSYLDVFMISSDMPSVFVASVDGVKNSALLGPIARIGGGIFVDRLSRNNIVNEIRHMTEIINKGFNIVLFPEATTSNGDGVLDFKSSLLDPALKSKVNVLPLCIKYKRVGEQPLDSGNRDKVYYYGDAEFFSHLIGVMKLQSVEAEITVLEQVQTININSRKEITDKVYNSISVAYCSG
ncbi:MAG: 1-acyl-sn-glycerol-3-phosphate acyltransferase [Candidatus Dadabacteria bacterium]|nr:1-acyl-sn-glycerol-3-phosphate acyltransferase [Candidatus Dadabacteria bacterium]NIS08639.1 1-acyl-sn-glycerol-3-phosphate acyltransferase [Candidatus Dadabacteria bacterium]NIV42473.1 hypothetical protein [Candidatus Dadabacteria bacterium]NIY22014.1 hypothetical protein [Candidatus Dadabacteria bacterium]